MLPLNFHERRTIPRLAEVAVALLLDHSIPAEAKQLILVVAFAPMVAGRHKGRSSLRLDLFGLLPFVEVHTFLLFASWLGYSVGVLGPLLQLPEVISLNLRLPRLLE